MFEGEDAESSAGDCEEDPVSTGAQTEFAGVFALKQLHIALAGEGVVVQGFKNPHGGSAVEGADIGAGLPGPIDLKRHSV